MTDLLVKTRDSVMHRLAPTGHPTIMEAVRDAGIGDLLALCGGSCSCATCHVYLDEVSFGIVGKMTDDEHELLETSAHRREYSRLACQVRIPTDIGSVSVEIAPED